MEETGWKQPDQCIKQPTDVLDLSCQNKIEVHVTNVATCLSVIEYQII
jgi:hypothetical protein